jgi:hypothetical protein
MEPMTDNDKLKIASDAPSMVVLLDAGDLHRTSRSPRDADATFKKLLAILDDGKVVRAVDTLLLTD